METILLTLPIVPGKQEAWRRFCQELQGARRTEFEASRRRLGITEEVVWLAHDTTGETAVLLLSAADPERALAGLAVSHTPFDRWFRRQVRNLHGVDLSQPVRSLYSERVLVWYAHDSA